MVRDEYNAGAKERIGQEDEPGISEWGTSSGVAKVKWVVVVARASQSFTLHLPGEQTVKLDSLLE